MGNRQVMTDTLGAHTYAYDAANRLTSVDGTTYTWDARGNLTHDDVFTYTYNAAGRMVSAESLTTTLVYTYTADGLRVGQGADDGVMTFAWDWAFGVPEMLSDSTNIYLVGHETLGQWDGSEWMYYLPDALGSVRQVADEAGAVTAAREWTPYGARIGATEGGPGYAGEWQDAGVGLQYLRARWYRSYLNRWISPDTIVPDLANPQSLNRYSYVYNNPVKYTDPSGHCSPEDEECNEWADRIEQEWNGQVVIVRCTGDWGDACVHWQADEMEMLYETLDEHALSQYLDIPLTFVRVEGEDYAGLHTPAGGDGDKSSTIRISSNAWRTPPAMGLYDLFDGFFKKKDYFQGTIAHELTHAAVWSHPEVLDQWMEQDQPSLRVLAVGLLYDWSYYDDRKDNMSEEEYERLEENEFLAMTVSALMYDPWWNQGRQ